MVDKHGYCTLCRSRCGAIYTVEGSRLLGVRPDPGHPTGAALCPKGRAAPELAHSTDRLTTPLRRTTPKSDPDPRWKPIGWDEAMDEIATRLAGIRDTSGAEAVAFSVTSPSATSMSDSIDWVERFVRLFGSPNICYATEICNWHKDFAHAFTFGTGMPAPDYAGTDLAVLWGHNPAKSWLAQSAALADARTRGTRLAVIDPRRSTSALQADHWLRVFPGTDAALALGLADLVLTNRSHDDAFVRAWSNAPLLVHTDSGRFLRATELDPTLSGYVAWDEHADEAVPYDTAFAAPRPERFALRGRRRVATRSGVVTCVPAFERYAEACAAWPIERTAAVTGVEPHVLRSFADDLARASSVCYHAWSGVGQHDNATQTERAIATLYALTGSFDRPGGNVVQPKQPVNAVTSPEQLTPEQRAKSLGAQRFPLGPPAQGWITARELCESALAGRPYPVRALVSFGGNLLLSQPDPRRTAEALRSLEFSVHLDLFANPTANLADILLPVGTAWEREGLRAGFDTSREASEHVQLRPRMIPPVGESRSDTEIVFDLASRLGMGRDFFDGDIDAARDHQLAPLGLTVEDLRSTPQGIRRPLPARHRKYAEVTDDGMVTGFATPTRRVELYSERLAEHGYPPVPQHEPTEQDHRFPLTLTCAKSGYFCHSQHRGITSLRKRSPEPTADIGPELAATRGIADGDRLRITTRNASVVLRARVDEALHPSVVVAEYGWWQSSDDLGLPGSDPLRDGGVNYNLLIDDERRDPVSGSVPMRSTACEIDRVPDDTWRGTREFTVDGVEPVTDDIVAVRLRPTGDTPLPDHRPGQYLSLALGDGTERSYSLIGPARSATREAYEIAIRRVPDGRFSTAAHDRFRAGTRLRVGAPRGTFALPVRHSRPIVLFAAGVGITPFLGYLETLARHDDPPEVHLHHGSRDGAHHAFADRIRRLAEVIPTLRVVDHYSRPAPGELGTGVRPGRVDAADIDDDLIARGARFYLCGPEAMLDELTAALTRRGVPRFHVFSERFHSAPQEAAIPGDLTATIHFARSGRRISWRSEDGTLLDVARRHGLSLPSGCRLGQCESCAVGVLSGSVTHLVRPADDLPADHCLTCQSVPTSDITLDA